MYKLLVPQVRSWVCREMTYSCQYLQASELTVKAQIVLDTTFTVISLPYCETLFEFLPIHVLKFSHD